jgi:peroxiredoxin
VVGLGIDNADAIRRFRKQLDLELPLLVAGATGSNLARELGNPSGALPYTVLISPQGTVVQARLGLIKPELLRSWLDARLNG